MKKENSLIQFAALLFVCMVALSSCKKTNPELNTLAASNNALAESIYNDLFKQVDEAAKNNADLNKTGEITGLSFAPCATVTINPSGTVFPKTVTIDFGNVNCMGTDGRYRRGKVEAVFTGKYTESGTVITITPMNYYVNDMKLEGEKTITNNGRNGNNNLTFSIVVANAKLTTPNGTLSWASSRTREWTVGESTTGPGGFLDDEYSITGDASGTNFNGNSYSVLITSALKVKMNCRWIVEGKMDVTPQNLEVRKVDYGTGDCDNNASITVNGNTHHFVMP